MRPTGGIRGILQASTMLEDIPVYSAFPFRQRLALDV
jgi:hypothetical protein